jgi:hypothetical protein
VGLGLNFSPPPPTFQVPSFRYCCSRTNSEELNSEVKTAVEETGTKISGHGCQELKLIMN